MKCHEDRICVRLKEGASTLKFVVMLGQKFCRNPNDLEGFESLQSSFTTKTVFIDEDGQNSL